MNNATEYPLGDPLVSFLTFEPAQDITGYHPDRIFLSESRGGSFVLVAFDEYEYNNGEGFLHTLNYDYLGADTDGRAYHFLYFDIPEAKLQYADHEAKRVGRRIMLFDKDGRLLENLQDPVGLTGSIGSIGILN